MSDFIGIVKKRRSIYGIGREPGISEQELENLIEESVLHAPSAFNSQSARVVLFLNENHERLWQIVYDTLEKRTTPEKFSGTRTKLDSFKKGFGTILFYEDMDVIEALRQRFPRYTESFPAWSEQGSGILQFVIWTAFAEREIGASLQHYNPIIDDETAKTFGISSRWKLIAQMPFGSITEDPGEKQFLPAADRFFVKK